MDLGGTFASGLLAAIAYGALAGILPWRANRSAANYMMAVAAAVTALWAMSLAFFPASSLVLGVCRDGAWFALVIQLLREDCPEQGLWKALSLGAASIIAIGLILSIYHLRTDNKFGAWLTPAAAQLAAALVGLGLVENLVRNQPPARRWSTKLLAIGLTVTFGYNLVMLIPAFLEGRSIPPFLEAQPLIYLLVLPLFLVTAVRYDGMQLKLHTSRRVAFQSATLIFSGILLQGTAAAALYVRTFGGTPAVVLSIALGFTGIVALFVLLSSHMVRSQIRTFINENFYSYKYDYRVEWTKFIAALTQYGESGTSARILHTLCDLLDSPGGVLWVHRRGWHQFVPLAHLAFKDHVGPIDVQDELLQPLQNPSLAYVELAEEATDPAARLWYSRFPNAWLAVPLRFSGTLSAVALLHPPRAPRRLDWEDKNLVGLIATQLAAHIVHEHTAQALADSEQLAEFNSRVAFALHDLKNTAGQLTLLMHNAERYGSNPEFQADMTETLRHAVGNLSKLIFRLRHPDPTAETISETQVVDIMTCLDTIAVRRFARKIVVEGESGRLLAAISKPDAFLNALQHVVSNAVEASPEEASVHIRATRRQGRICIRVEDEGPGMSADFIARELFRPLRSTKRRGLGIGSYQARSIIRTLGGDIDVDSAPGRGTRVDLYLPEAEQQSTESAA